MGKVPSTPAAKPERKKPVRKAPVQKDYPNKLAWLKAMTSYEESLATASDEAKLIRLDKRIKAKRDAVDKVAGEITKLEHERAVLTSDWEVLGRDTEPEAPAPQP